MHAMRLSGKIELFKTRILSLETIVKSFVVKTTTETAFMLALIIYAEVVKTDANFLTYY